MNYLGKAPQQRNTGLRGKNPAVVGAELWGLRLMTCQIPCLVRPEIVTRRRNHELIL